MKQTVYSITFIALYLMLFPGCNQYVCWAQETFKTADKVCTDIQKAHDADVRFAPMRRSIGMTVALPRVLYRSNQVIAAHERLRAECAGIPDKKLQKQIVQLHDENDRETVFFVSTYEYQENWGFTLCKDGRLYEATEIKQVDLDRDYLLIFGKAATRYQQNIYQLTFDVGITKPFSLVLCNGEYRTELCW